MARRPAASELLAWTLLGATLGAAAGYLAAEWAAPLRAGRKRPVNGDPERSPTGAALVRLARQALDGDPALRDLALEVVPALPGVVELHGWVPARSLRARAARLVAASPAIVEVVNCLLVRGEDDLGMASPDETPSPA